MTVAMIDNRTTMICRKKSSVILVDRRRRSSEAMREGAMHTHLRSATLHAACTPAWLCRVVHRFCTLPSTRFPQAVFGERLRGSRLTLQKSAHYPKTASKAHLKTLRDHARCSPEKMARDAAT